MHKNTLFLSFFLLIFVSCNEKRIKEENNISNQKINHRNTIDKTFDLTGIFNQHYKVSIQENKIKINTNKPITIINIFNPFSTLSYTHMKSLNQLQKEYHQNIFTLSLSLEDTTKKRLLELTATYNLNYLIVNTTPESKNLAILLKKQISYTKNYILPLTIVYLKGKYFTYYEGIVPLEMMRYDLTEAEKNLKSKK